jgi:hypothetical protein
VKRGSIGCVFVSEFDLEISTTRQYAATQKRKQDLIVPVGNLIATSDSSVKVYCSTHGGTHARKTGIGHAYTRN